MEMRKEIKKKRTKEKKQVNLEICDWIKGGPGKSKEEGILGTVPTPNTFITGLLPFSVTLFLPLAYVLVADPDVVLSNPNRMRWTEDAFIPRYAKFRFFCNDLRSAQVKICLWLLHKIINSVA